MEKHAEDARRKAMVIDIDMLVPKDHLLRKIEKVMDYDWLYERLNPLSGPNHYVRTVGRLISALCVTPPALIKAASTSRKNRLRVKIVVHIHI